MCRLYTVQTFRAVYKLCIVNSQHVDQRVAWMIQDELVNELKKQIAILEKTNKNQLQENAEEINRLHRSLKESQQECRELLEAR